MIDFVVLYRNEIWIKELFISLDFLNVRGHHHWQFLLLSVKMNIEKTEQAIFVQDFDYLQQKVGL